MKQTEAISIIQAIANSINTNPGQFQFEINVIGTSATGTSGGTGISVNVTGGGVGSNTIGFHSEVNGTNIQIAQKTANEAIQREMAWLHSQMQTIIDELKSQSPNHDNLRKVYHSLVNTWVPGLIISVIGNILTMALGISLS
jgi:hypothetical protein